VLAGAGGGGEGELVFGGGGVAGSYVLPGGDHKDGVLVEVAAPGVFVAIGVPLGAASGRLDDMHAKQIRLADITGRGEATSSDQRRSRKEVMAAYADEPSGAKERIRSFGRLVSTGISSVARDPKRREQFKAGTKVSRDSHGVLSWRVQVRLGQRLDEAIAIKLLRDPTLWTQVYEILHAQRSKLP
jgi:hypothetical protein